MFKSVHKIKFVGLIIITELPFGLFTGNFDMYKYF